MLRILKTHPELAPYEKDLDLRMKLRLLFLIVRAGILGEHDLGIERVDILLRPDDLKTDILQLRGQLFTLLSQLSAAACDLVDLFLCGSDLQIQLRELFARIRTAQLQLFDTVKA